jgi:hypothetical protein
MSIEAGYAAARRAAAHASNVEPKWEKVGWCRMLEFLIHLGPGATFTTEDFRDWVWEGSRLGDPPDNRAFGNLTRQAVGKGLVVDSMGRPRSRNPQAHGREVILWRVV